MLQPRPSRAPRCRSRSPRKPPRPAARPPPPPPPDRSLRDRAAASASSAPRRTQIVVAVPGAALEEVLGPQGQMLKDVCRQTGALVALRPDMDCAEDGYVAHITGSEAAMAAAEAWVRDLLTLAEIAAAREDQEPPLGEELRGEPSDLEPPWASDDDAEDAVELQGDRLALKGSDGETGVMKKTEDIEFPQYKSEVVLEMRAPGQAVLSFNAALRKLKARFELDELRFVAWSMEGSPSDTTVIRAQGNAHSVDNFVEACAERLARCDDFGMERPPPNGSTGHPDTCAATCKFFSRGKGCKDGQHCAFCHLCTWKRSGASRSAPVTTDWR